MTKKTVNGKLAKLIAFICSQFLRQCSVQVVTNKYYVTRVCPLKDAKTTWEPLMLEVEWDNLVYRRPHHPQLAAMGGFKLSYLLNIRCLVNVTDAV